VVNPTAAAALGAVSRVLRLLSTVKAAMGLSGHRKTGHLWTGQTRPLDYDSEQ